VDESVPKTELRTLHTSSRYAVMVKHEHERKQRNRDAPGDMDLGTVHEWLRTQTCTMPLFLFPPGIVSEDTLSKHVAASRPSKARNSNQLFHMTTQ
jgi:hypothetical protein